MVLHHKLSWIFIIIMLFQYSGFPVEGGAEPLVPCYFIFGDSLVDNGNNNYLMSWAKGNFWPYGIDFPAGPTGRFCNGRTGVDIIGQLLGFKEFIPPYATANGKEILRGVNYASAAAGIRDETGGSAGEKITFSQQLNNFKTTVSRVIEMLGSPDIAADHLRRCVYTITMGANDYNNDYLTPNSSTNIRYTPDQYAKLLVQKYYHQLQTMYSYGARKFAIFGIGLIGNTPAMLARYSLDGKTPVESFNSVVQLFNYRLKRMVEEFNSRALDANSIYLNASDVNQDIFANPTAYGFKVMHSACCGEGRNNGERICPHGHIPCKNRSDHFFWDAFHPTEAANIIISKRFFHAEKPSDSYPFDIHTLAQLK